MRSNDVRLYLKDLFPDINSRNGSKGDSETLYLSTFVRPSGTGSRIALGGLANTTYNTLPISILVHWNENYDESESKANEIYNALLGKSNIFMGTGKARSVFMLDSYPQSIGRTDKNKCEFVIRCNIQYERQ